MIICDVWMADSALTCLLMEQALRKMHWKYGNDLLWPASKCFHSDLEIIDEETTRLHKVTFSIHPLSKTERECCSQLEYEQHYRVSHEYFHVFSLKPQLSLCQFRGAKLLIAQISSYTVLATVCYFKHRMSRAVLTKRCVDSCKNNSSQSSLMTHKMFGCVCISTLFPSFSYFAVFRTLWQWLCSTKPVTVCRVWGRDYKNIATRCQMMSSVHPRGAVELRPPLNICVYERQPNNLIHSAFNNCVIIIISACFGRICEFI